MNKYSLLIALAVSFSVHAQSAPKIPKLPTSSTASSPFKGSVGAGFTDFRTLSPDKEFQLERGVYTTGQLERGFDFLHLYITFSLSYLNGNGTSKYQYTNQSSTTSYSLNNVSFKAEQYQGSLGVKFKLIDGYWFRPYVEGGGIGSYQVIDYGNNLASLKATGTDYKTKDAIMGSGYYAEAGVEIDFSDKFGIKVAARESIMQTKALETLADHTIRLDLQTFYLAALFGF